MFVISPSSPVPFLRVVRIENQRLSTLHTHGQLKELVIIIRGRCRHLTATGCYPLKEGDVFIVPEDTPHGYDQTNDVGLINILYNPQQLALPLHDLNTIPGYHALQAYDPQARSIRHFGGSLGVGQETLQQADYLTSRIEEELNTRAPGYIFAAAGYMMQIICLVARSCLERHATASGGVNSLGLALGYLERHYKEHVSVGELAKAASVSESTLNRLFRRYLRCSPAAQLINLRLEKAKSMLLDMDLTVDHIASACGFHDASHFSRLFKRSTTLSPTDWRRRQT